MRNKKTITVNFFAGPSSGKSTSAAQVFAHLKNQDCNVELIREFAKDVVYKKSEHELRNQLYVLAKQYKRMKDVADYGVKLILTDSPLSLSLIYARDLHYFAELKPLIDQLNSEFININVFVRRVKKYNPSGRLQNESQSDDISKRLKKLIEFDYVIDGNPAGQVELADILYKKYKRRIAV